MLQRFLSEVTCLVQKVSSTVVQFSTREERKESQTQTNTLSPPTPPYLLGQEEAGVFFPLNQVLRGQSNSVPQETLCVGGCY